MPTTRPAGAGDGSDARVDTSRRDSPVLYPMVLTAVGAAVLSTVALVLWLPIDQAAIERADRAGWDQTLLLPHQLLLTVVLWGTCLCSWLTAVVTGIGLRWRTSRT